MKTALSFMAAFLMALAMLPGPSAQAAPVSLTAGMYYEQELVLSATPVNGGSCSDAAGEYIAEWVTQPGANQTGFSKHRPFNVNGALGVVVYNNFPKTPKAGSTSWSGTAAWTNYESGTVARTGTLSFDVSYALPDAYSIYGTNTVTVSTGGVQVCQEVLQFSEVFTGLQ